MSRPTNRLTEALVAQLKQPGMHADGAGLYLRIDQDGGRRWSFIYHRDQRRREMSLGPVSRVRLPDARAAAAEARSVFQAGDDPIAQRRRRADGTRPGTHPQRERAAAPAPLMGA